MSNNIILGTQIISIVVYLASLFYIYKVLIAAKDATIENLNERINLLKEPKKELAKNQPDVY